MHIRLINNIYKLARNNGGAVALLDNAGAIDYQTLLASMHLIRYTLIKRGVKKGDRVAICSNNSVECLICLLAIMDAGCTFVPLSARDPEDRLLFICETAQPALILTDSDQRLPSLNNTLTIDEALYGQEEENLEFDQPESVQLEDILYVIFTSGTTGKPKGVCIPVASFNSALQSTCEALMVSDKSRSLAILPFYFDGSFSSFFPELHSGGSVYVHNSPLCLPSTFLRICAEHEITHTTVTPTYLLSIVNDHSWQEYSLEHLQALALGGESSGKSILKLVKQRYPKLSIYNRYGPTEATMAVSTYEITDEDIYGEGDIPIGLPHPGLQFLALNPEGNALSANEKGELYVAGSQLMQGYLGDEALTKKVLGDHFNQGQLWLKTGDTVSINAKGLYVCHGRNDRIAKRNGVRVSLDEIEASLASLTHYVKSSVCVLVKRGERSLIISFINLLDGDVSDSDLRKLLLEKLPSTMIPDEFVLLPDFPRTASGKVDLQALISGYQERQV